MRALTSCFAAAAMLVTASPALAQNQSTGERVLRGVLQGLIGPEEQPQQQPQQPQQPVEQTPQVLTDAQRLQQVLADPRRGDEGARDRYRHPAETLDFFQVKPGMTVVDYMPNGWWYSKILVPYLGPQGRYIGMNPDVSRMTGYLHDTYSDVAGKLAAAHANWASAGDAQVFGFNTQDYPEALDGTVDRVLLIREMHNQLRFGWLHADMLAIRRMLKPGGMVGLIDHRMYEDAPYSMTDGNKGYLRQSDVIDLMDVYGFDLVASNEINANPLDTKDYDIGVWALPPNLAGATNRNRAQRLAIGESDRMTLLFRKRD